VAALVAFIGLAGCGGPPTGDDDSRPTMRQLPPPAVERMEYNKDTHTLSLYHLPASGRWVVQSPGESATVEVGPKHVLPETADPEATMISYRRPSGQASGWVSVADILAARATHASPQ
jgi:hypothetical protein